MTCGLLVNDTVLLDRIPAENEKWTQKKVKPSDLDEFFNLRSQDEAIVKIEFHCYFYLWCVVSLSS